MTRPWGNSATRPGAKFHKLILVRETDERLRRAIVGIWQCSCGNEKRATIPHVKSGVVKSCGCLRTTHGESAGTKKTREYVAWQAMHARCNAKKGRDYKSYKAKGITVCRRWQRFTNFLIDIGRKPSPKMSLGRINNDRGYSPSNCEWQTSFQQLRNTTRSMTWSIQGKTFPSLREAARHFGVDGKTIRYWVRVSKTDTCSTSLRY